MTKHLRGAMLASAAALVWCLNASVADADESNRETILTIDQSMTVPGATLAPGTYTFTLGNENSSRDLVYIFHDENGSRSLVTSARVMRVPRGNDKRDLALAVVFDENGAMPVMKGWFYPGQMDGFQFVYPKEQRQLIARAETVVIPVAPRG
jgi:hypothetical protein